MVPRVGACVLLLVLAACGGGGDDGGASSTNVPPNAAAMEAGTKVGMKSAVARMSTYEAGLMFALNPGSSLTPGVVVQPDPGAAAPFSVTFAGDLASDFAEPATTHVSGKATYASDPSGGTFGSVTGTAAIDVTILGIMSIYHADIAFTVTDTERTVSGQGVLRNPLTGNKTTMTVDPAKPMRMTLASGASANACGYVMDGDAYVVVVGPQGTYAATWRFVPGQDTVSVINGSHTDSMGNATYLPDTQADLRCNNANANIADWVGVYHQVWGCLPYELGTATLTLTVKDANTITINDEDPPGSGDGNTYDAVVVGSSVRSIRGFFLDSSSGATYREDFNWNLSPDGKRFMQTSRYVWQNGPLAGQGGNCFAVAVKQ